MLNLFKHKGKGKENIQSRDNRIKGKSNATEVKEHLIVTDDGEIHETNSEQLTKTTPPAKVPKPICKSPSKSSLKKTESICKSPSNSSLKKAGSICKSPSNSSLKKAGSICKSASNSSLKKSESICKSPSSLSLEKTSATKGGEDGHRRLSDASNVSISSEAEKHTFNLRKTSIASVKWADLDADSHDGTPKVPNPAHDGIPKMNSLAHHEILKLGQQSLLHFKVDSFDDDADETTGHHTVAYSVIPEEEETGDESLMGSTNVSSGETEEEVDGSSDSANKRKSRKSSKDRRLTFPKILFPGLRKDSIALYRDQSGLGSSNEDCEHAHDYPVTNNGAPSKSMISPGGSILKRRSSKIRMNKEMMESFFTILSGMYAMFLTILGTVLPIAEVFADEKHPLLFEVFYIYMYGGSILFLAYVYLYLLRKSTGGEKPIKPRKRKVSVDQIHSHTGSFYLRLGAVAFGTGSMIHTGLQLGEYFQMEAWFQMCTQAIFGLRPVIHLLFTFFQLYFVFMNSKMCINRYKTVARFGLMHMVATNICVWFNTIVVETLHQVQSIDHHQPESHASAHDVTRQHHGKSLKFNVTTSSNIHIDDIHTVTDHNIHEHGIVENVTDFINNSLHEIYSNAVSHGDGDSPSTPTHPVDQGALRGCDGTSLMMNVLETAGPYLYPCSIEYSLICAGIIYTLWKNTGRRVTAMKSDEVDEEAHQQRISVDCSNSSRGLFSGILVLVGTIITMVVFFVLVDNPDYYSSATMVEYLSEIALYFISTIAVVMAAIRMRNLCFNSTRETDFEEVLILISLVGDYMFELLSIVAAIFDAEHYASRFNIATRFLGITQSSVQTIFVLIALRRSAKTQEQQAQKSGREFVTFLLISNIAMWCINTFEAQRTVASPVQIHYYGALAWNILIHISIPMGIFFRFHSTVCLSNVWKHAWKGHW